MEERIERFKGLNLLWRKKYQQFPPDAVSHITASYALENSFFFIQLLQGGLTVALSQEFSHFTPTTQWEVSTGLFVGFALLNGCLEAKAIEKKRFSHNASAAMAYTVWPNPNMAAIISFLDANLTTFNLGDIPAIALFAAHPSEVNNLLLNLAVRSTLGGIYGSFLDIMIMTGHFDQVVDKLEPLNKFTNKILAQIKHLTQPVVQPVQQRFLHSKMTLLNHKSHSNSSNKIL